MLYSAPAADPHREEPRVNQPVIAPQDYAAFSRFLEQACGIVLGDNKHYLVVSRLRRLLQEFSFATLGEMLKALEAERRPQLRERIIDAMTTNETMWFRDRYPFEILKTHILPELARAGGGPLRIWSAACSSGQEAYSISMTVSEFMAERPGVLTRPVEIVATDISPSVLRLGREACYEGMSVNRGLSPARRDRFFRPAGDRWEVRPEIRQRVRFTELNLLQSYALLGRFDVVFCRNVLIYFSAELKRDILARTAQTLGAGGILFLGGSESPSSYSDAYQMQRYPEGVAYRRK